jgi:hypothetical protein
MIFIQSRMPGSIGQSLSEVERSGKHHKGNVTVLGSPINRHEWNHARMMNQTDSFLLMGVHMTYTHRRIPNWCRWSEIAVVFFSTLQICLFTAREIFRRRTLLIHQSYSTRNDMWNSSYWLNIKLYAQLSEELCFEFRSRSRSCSSLWLSNGCTAPASASPRGLLSVESFGRTSLLPSLNIKFYTLSSEDLCFEFRSRSPPICHLRGRPTWETSLGLTTSPPLNMDWCSYRSLSDSQSN